MQETLRPMGHHLAAALVGVGSLAFVISALADDAPLTKPSTSITASKVIEPVAPIVPAEVVALMQSGNYKEAIAAIERIAAKAKPEEKDYLALIRGIAERLSGDVEAARATWKASLANNPKGPWAVKIHHELASVELAAGRFAAAEELARGDTAYLLAGSRKDRLAEVYYAFARKLLRPDDPITPADPVNAYGLLEQARQLAKGETLRAKLLFEMGLAAQKSGKFDIATRDFQAYLASYKQGEDRPAASYHLGEVQFQSGQALPARLTWTDLAADLAKAPGSAHPSAAEIRAKALYQISKTHGLPNPPDDTQLNLGVAALQRFLAAYPANALAVKAAYEIAESFQNRGKSEQAIQAYTAFLQGTAYRAETEDARKDLSTLSMTATFQVAKILQTQSKFAEAITAFKGYLAKYPNGPQSAAAQVSILETQLAEAQDKLRKRQFAEARKAWTDFVTQNPLDPRVPQLLYQIGETFVTEEKFDEAITAWDPLLSKFPGSEPAGHAQFQIASIFEIQKGNPSTAIERFRLITVEPWKSSASQRVAIMESRALTVISPKAFRSGETPHLKIATRNLETLTFTAYKLSAETYFRKKHLMGNVESLDVSLVAPDAEWTVPVKDYGKYKPIDTTYDLKVTVPGVYVVKVSDEKHLQATTLVLGSDIDTIVKSSREQLLVFAQDMKTGKGRPNARVLISDGSSIILETTTGPDGVLLTNWEKPRDPSSGFQYLVIDGGDVASSGLGLPGTVAQGLSARAYLYTDRPAYRPGNSVEIRGVVREVSEGQYSNPASQVYRLEIYDSRGRLIVAKPVTLSKFGTFNEHLELDSATPVGTYRMRLFQPGKSDFSGNFVVQSYRLEKMDLSFDLPRTVYFRGETIRGEVVAKFQYGAPVANRAIQVVLPDGRQLTGETDAAGKFKVEFATEGFAEEQQLQLVARLPQDNVAVVANVSLAVRAFRIDLGTNREVYLDGESFLVKATTLDAQGEPIGEELKVSVLKRVEQFGATSEVEVSKATLTTEKKTGQGSLSLKVDDADGGSFVVRASGTDRFGNAVVTDRVLTISGKKDETKLRILADRQSFKVGETAKVVLHSRAKPGPALLAWEADRVLSYRLIDVKEGENAIEWLVDGGMFPNFTLTAARMVDTRFDSAALDVKVERDLRISLSVDKPTAGPGEEVQLNVTAVDQLGRPVEAELAVALVDRSLLRLFGDRMPEIGAYFYNQSRTGSFTTVSTNTFRYDTVTRPVEEAVVEEAARQAAVAANAATRGNLAEQAKNQVVMADIAGRSDPRSGQLPAALPAPAPMAPAPPGAGGPGGAYGRPAMAGKEMGMMGGMGGGAMMEGRAAGDAPGDFDAKADAEEDRRRESFALRANKPSGMPRKMTTLAKEEEKTAPRERFIETAYWNPSIVTAADGKASVKIKAPMAMSTYRFTARGTTGADSLVGQSTTELVIKKDFFVDIKAPSILIQGDRPRFVAQLHHQGVSGKANVSFTTYAGGRQLVAPKTAELKGDGVTELAFEPFDVPEGDVVRLTLKATVAEKSDELVLEIPIRPWGVQAIASASGTSSDGTTVFVGLPAGRTYDSPEMLVVVSPSVRRMLVELALGRDAYVYPSRFDRCIFPPSHPTIADRAGELIGVASVLKHLAAIKTEAPPEAARLSAAARELVSELITLQNDDGGWPWVSPVAGQKSASHPLTSARAAFALRVAQELGLVTDPGVVDRSINFLNAQFARTNASDLETRAAVLHALSTHKHATFELANSLNRIRQNLNDVSLAYLALTMANLDRQNLANEILDILASRAKTEAAGPGKPARTYWTGANQHWHLPTETTALVSFAFATSRPQAPQLASSVEWLLAHRVGSGWQPPKSKGPALAALSSLYSIAQPADDRYRLVVTVNDTEIFRSDVVGSTEGKAIAIPRKVLKLGDPNRIRFDVEGRGTFSYSITMAGFTRDFAPDQKREGRDFVVNSREYLHAEPELEGRTLPTGFSTAVNPREFTNKVTQVGLGGRARVQVDVYRYEPGNRPVWERPALTIEETLPAGTTLIDGSIRTSATSYEVNNDKITFYFAPEQYPGSIQYEVFGYLPGQYRSLPTIVRNAYDPGKYHLGFEGQLRVLSPGEPETDSYKATPDELFARGKTHFDAGRYTDARGPLEELSTNYTLRDDILKQTTRMLLTVHIKDYDPRKIVQDFEILKEKAPDILIPFDEVSIVGLAYRDINEHERAYLVWRAIIEASYLEDAQVGEVLRQKGKSLDAIAYLLALWREYPNTSSIEADFFAISQLIADRATKAFVDPALRKELADVGVTRTQLLVQSMRLIQVLLSQSPKTPLADEASLALVGTFLELEDYQTVVALSNRFAKLYPKSTFFDSFQYSEAYGDFNLGKYDQAIELAEKISKATYKDANGVDQPSPNKWQALYILGQIYDARRVPAKAVGFYQQVADRFTDAAGAAKSLTRKDLKLPEVSLVRLAGTAAPKVGLNAVPPAAATKPEVKLDYRNIAEAEVKVYPVDLMRLYLTRRNLDAIAGIDLAGITPLHEAKVKLGEGQDFEDKIRTIELPLTKEGAYLVMIRGGDLYASGILLVSPLELEVLEEPESGRVRVTVRDAKTKDGVPRVQVKVIGSNNPAFISGQTDLRGVFVAEGVNGQVTAVARRETAQYAFYRGTTFVGAPPAPVPVFTGNPNATAPGQPMAPQSQTQSLDFNLKSIQTENTIRQMERLENRYKGGSRGINPGAAK